MTTPTPTPELLDAARRVKTGTWTVAENEPGYPTDPHLAQLLDAGLVLLHYPPTRHRADYWRLTPDGEQRLRDAEADAMWSHTSGPNP